MAQKSRKQKTSAGINGGGGKLRTPLTDVQKVLMGKGMLVGINNNKTRRAQTVLTAKGHNPLADDKPKPPRRSVKEQLDDYAAK